MNQATLDRLAEVLEAWASEYYSSDPAYRHGYVDGMKDAARFLRGTKPL